MTAIDLKTENPIAPSAPTLDEVAAAVRVIASHSQMSPPPTEAAAKAFNAVLGEGLVLAGMSSVLGRDDDKCFVCTMGKGAAILTLLHNLADSLPPEIRAFYIGEELQRLNESNPRLAIMALKQTLADI